MAQVQVPLFVDQAQEFIDVRIVQHQEAFGVADGVGVLLQHGDAEAVEGIDVRGIVVSGQVVDAAAHLFRRLIGEGDAEDMGGQNAHLHDQVGVAGRERLRFAAAGAGDDAHETFGGSHRFELFGIEFF